MKRNKSELRTKSPKLTFIFFHLKCTSFYCNIFSFILLYNSSIKVLLPQMLPPPKHILSQCPPNTITCPHCQFHKN
jgi:hypothetical protein